MSTRHRTRHSLDHYRQHAERAMTTSVGYELLAEHARQLNLDGEPERLQEMADEYRREWERYTDEAVAAGYTLEQVWS